jgi:hypothetical protein
MREFYRIFFKKRLKSFNVGGITYTQVKYDCEDYLLSTEKIEEGDYIFDTSKLLLGSEKFKECAKYLVNTPTIQKVVASSDYGLSKLPSIPMFYDHITNPIQKLTVEKDEHSKLPDESIDEVENSIKE